MNKHSLIVIISSIVIIGVVGNSVWNIYAVEQLQLSGKDGIFRYYEGMVGQDKIITCNPLFLTTSFNQLYITVFFEGKVKGIFSIDGTSIPPKSSQILDAEFSSESFAEIQYYFLHFDGMFSGTAPIRIDAKKLAIETEFQTPILGIIPFSVTNQYTGIDFWNMLNEDKNSKC
ncbi:hypothetical protein AAA799E16_01908 [Marine Group I thaumarchaeote SCGC AAA799-E16]|uniref:Uncharacterized protein n=1 Tax=Marine Group I thaumarchaeote SCGC AAA799-E16 TaxID=1502292 RepID=A0A081S3E6_9ARCH|nr:hypothetical protein AAA799E16_01908 [Marine Group I thaumarchaeote SCGC AAA799-E16]